MFCVLEMEKVPVEIYEINIYVSALPPVSLIFLLEYIIIFLTIVDKSDTVSLLRRKKTVVITYYSTERMSSAQDLVFAEAYICISQEI